MGVDETIQVRCTRCKTKFRDKARRVRDGYSRQCLSCERMMFFTEGSPNKDISDALREAHRVRKLLSQAEEEKIMRPAAAAASSPETEEFEAAPAVSRRVDRRAKSSGRATDRAR